jgi:MFS family permease
MSLPRRPRRPRLGSSAKAMLHLLAIAAALYTAVTGFRITTALAAVSFGMSPAAIGPMLAVYSLVPLLLAARGGRMIDRIGVRRPMVGGALLAMLGAAACAALPHPAVMTVAVACTGLGLMSFHLGIQHATGEIGGPGRRTANFNMLTMSFSVSGLLGPPMVGVLIDHAGHQAAFGATAALAGIVLLASRRFPFERHLGSAADSTEAASGTSGAGPGTGAFALLGSPRIRRLVIASLLVSAAWDTYQFVMPLHAATIGLSASAVGLALASFSAGSLTVRLVLPTLVSRMAPARWMLVAICVCVVSYAAVPFASALGVLMAISFIVGIGPGIAQPLLLAALHGASPPGRAGETAGLRLTLSSGMQLALPIVLGLLVVAAGTAPLFWLYSAVTGVIGLWLMRAPRSRPADEDRPAP